MGGTFFRVLTASVAFLWTSGDTAWKAVRFFPSVAELSDCPGTRRGQLYTWRVSLRPRFTTPVASMLPWQWQVWAPGVAVLSSCVEGQWLKLVLWGLSGRTSPQSPGQGSQGAQEPSALGGPERPFGWLFAEALAKGKGW